MTIMEYGETIFTISINDICKTLLENLRAISKQNYNSDTNFAIF